MDPKLFAGALDNIERGQLKSLREKIKTRPELLNSPDPDSYRGTLLHTAVFSRRPEIVQYLLDQGAEPNVTDSPYKLMTPLHYAASGSLEIIQALVAAGAEIAPRDKTGQTPLDYAINNAPGFFYLLDQGAEMTDPDRLLRLVVTGGSPSIEVMRYLLDEAASDSPPDDSGPAPGGVGNNSALKLAAQLGRLEVVKLLLDHGAAKGGGGQDGRAALAEARRRGDQAIVAALLEAGVPDDQEPHAPSRAEGGGLDLIDQAFGFATGGQPDGGSETFTWPEGLPELPQGMTEFITKMFTGEIFDDLKKMRADWVADHLARGRCLVRENRPLKEVLADLEREFDRLDPRLSLLFNPGLSAPAFNDLIKDLDCPIEAELADLYQWHNGTVNYESSGLSGLFGPYCFFNPLEEARLKMEGLSPVKSDDYLEIMSDGAGGWVEVDLRPDQGRRGLVYEVYKVEQDSPVIYPGLNAFFGAFLACFRKGAYRVLPGAGDDGRDLLVGHHQLIKSTLAAFALRLPEEIDENDPVSVDLDPADGDGLSIYDYQVPLPAR